MTELDDHAPRFHRFIGIRGSQCDQSRNSAQGRELFHRLVRWTVFAARLINSDLVSTDSFLLIVIHTSEIDVHPRSSRLQGWPDDGGIRSGQCNNFVLVTDDQLLSLPQTVGCRIRTDFDV
jgi:hypothetical protein